MLEAKSFTPIGKSVMVSEIEAGEQKVGSVIIVDDDMKDRGIRPRWCKVFAVGPLVDNLKKGDWILVDHGRWTRGYDAVIDGFEATFRFVDYDDILIVTDEAPNVITK